MKEALHHYCEQKQYHFSPTQRTCETSDGLEFWLGVGAGLQDRAGSSSLNREHSRCWGSGEEPCPRLDLLSDVSRGWKVTGKGSSLSARDLVLFHLVTQSDRASGQALGKYWSRVNLRGDTEAQGCRGCMRSHTEPGWSQAQDPLGLG